MKSIKNQQVEINRQPLWDSTRQEKYWSDTERLARKKAAEKDGEPTANDLDRVWDTLNEEEKKFIEFLLLSEKRTSVAFYEEELFTRLASKGLLQVPQGVGTILMQQLRTTYSVPKAVWKVLLDRRRHFVPLNGQKKEQRRDDLIKIFEGRIEALLDDTQAQSSDC